MLPGLDGLSFIAEMRKAKVHAPEINGMLGRIETPVEGMRAALDNVAHDLRTPVTCRDRCRAESGLGR
jgi:hypothetical protein